ncbi:hypothetical protein [Streptomyces europaeiscabiei]|uniref:hypothetical protein n=1 Tax=Streptomyces europaeiscabiei TaxID=146819 RepID=UPI002E17702B
MGRLDNLGFGRLREWWSERNSWELNQDALADICTLKSLAEARRQRTPPLPTVDQKMLDAADTELQRAEKVLHSGSHRRATLGSHVSAAQIHISAARVALLRSFSSNPAEVIHYLPSLQAVVKEHLPAEDMRRKVALNVTSEDLEDPAKGTSALFTTLSAVEVAYGRALREKLRAASFARIVLRVAFFLFLLTVGVAFLTIKWPGAVPLCFNPPQTEPSPSIQYTIVCPIQSDSSPDGDEIDKQFSENSTWGDYLVIETVGLVAAGVASASALRNIRGTSTPYQIPVALAALKLPAGALTAVLGLLLMRGNFVPGLSALDSSAQIIAWAVIFGYAQELFTKFVDKRGQMVLDAVNSQQ